MAIFDNLKSVGKVLQEAGKIEQYQQILETQKELLEMQKKINELEEKNKRLEKKLGIKENLIPENDLYWIQKDDNRDGPFCTRCWDSENKLIRLHSRETSFDKGFKCPKCKNIVSLERKSVKTQPYHNPNSYL